MSDQRIQYDEGMVGANHPTKSDTLNRLMLVEHNNDGTHDISTATLGHLCGLEASRKDSDEFYLEPGEVDIGGASYTATAQLTKQVSGLSADTWYYIYATAPSGDLTAGDISYSSTAPSFSGSKVGWYNGEDRCVGVFKSDGSSNILPFYCTGGWFFYGTLEDGVFLDTSSPASSKTAVAVGAPNLGRLAVLIHYYCSPAASREIAFDNGDSSADLSSNKYYRFEDIGGASEVALLTDASQQVNYRAQNNPSVTLCLRGFKLPAGMTA